LREVGTELATRYGVNVEIAVDSGVDTERTEHERTELVRIAREAIANAVRHGRARNVTVRLGSRRNDLLLRVSDDGCGFGSAGKDTAGTGLGMRTMRARAKSVGGRLVTRTPESGGVEIEVLSQK
jgi:signal transduction histidine kinase